MKYAVNRLLLLTLFIMIGCGENSFEAGKKAFESGDYTQAITHLMQVKDENLQDPLYSEMLALSYMYRGEQLFQRTKNLESFTGNYKKAKTWIPQNPSPGFKFNFSKLLYSLAESCLDARPENDIQKENNIQDAMTYLKLAVQFDSTNTAALTLIEETKQKHFEAILDYANKLYAKARDEKNIDLYFTSKDYMERAAEFEPDNQQVKQLKTKLNRTLLSILDHEDGLALAVAEFVRNEDQLTMVLAVENYLKSELTIEPGNFALVDYRGNTYGLDEKEMQLLDFMGKKCLKQTKLDTHHPYTDGILVFEVPKNIAIHFIRYRENGKEISRKYFQ